MTWVNVYQSVRCCEFSELCTRPCHSLTHPHLQIGTRPIAGRTAAVAATIAPDSTTAAAYGRRNQLIKGGMVPLSSPSLPQDAASSSVPSRPVSGPAFSSSLSSRLTRVGEQRRAAEAQIVRDDPWDGYVEPWRTCYIFEAARPTIGTLIFWPANCLSYIDPSFPGFRRWVVM